MNSDNIEKAAVYVTCVLSIFGSLFIIVSFALFKDFQASQSRRLLVILSFCDLLTALAYMIRNGPVDPNNSGEVTLCKIQSALNIFANQASFMWTDVIAIFVFVSRKYGMKTATKFLPLFHVLSWGIPIISLGAVAGENMWGYDNGSSTANWCWIKQDQYLWHIIAGKGVEWMSYIVVIVIYFLVFKDIRRAADQQLLLTHRSGATWRITEKKLLAIPLIFIILRLPGTIRTIYPWLHNGSDLWFPVLAILQAIGDSGQGFANGLLFGVFTEKVRAYYYRLLGRCSKRDEYGQVNETAGMVQYRGGNQSNPSYY